LEENDQKGENSIDSYLFGVLNVQVARKRLRAAIRRVNGDALQQRREQFGKKIIRREYKVGGPHRLWHVDGMHKLIRYGFIVHGCVDGFSRLVVWMRISTNNRATTQLSYFKAAMSELKITPSRMRGDLGGENILMADEIIALRGLDRGSFIFGLSRNNVRIERHWRDLRRAFTQFWMTFLRQLERERLLCIDDDHHLFVVQYLYASRMQREVDEHRKAYNNHKLSTERHYTPLQLCELYKDTIKDDPIGVGDDYGDYDDENEAFDDDDLPSDGNDRLSMVNLEPRNCPLTDMDWEIFQDMVKPVELSLPKPQLKDAFVEAMLVLRTMLDND